MPMRLRPALRCAWLASLLCLAGCLPAPAPLIPEGDIVFDTYADDTAQLGFVNADGTQLQLVPVKTHSFTKPVWSADGTTVYGIRWNSMPRDQGRLAVWTNNRLRACTPRDWYAVTAIISVRQTADETRALINLNYRGIWEVDVKRCKELAVLVDVRDQPGRGVNGGSLSPDGRQLLYTLTTFHSPGDTDGVIVKHDLATGQVEQLGSGQHPAWSPDGQQIAFIELDGIYVMDAHGQARQRIKRIDFENDWLPGTSVVLPPAPLWSPDGQWLVYHRCLDTPECRQDMAVFVLEVATGQETMVALGGTYPSWRGTLDQQTP